MTECKTETIQYHALGRREVRGQFDGGDISTDAGGLLLRETEKTDRDPETVCRMFPGLSGPAICGTRDRTTGVATGVRIVFGL